MEDRSDHNLFVGPAGLRTPWAILIFFALFALASRTFSVLLLPFYPRSPIAPSAMSDIAAGPFFLGEVPRVLAVAFATWILSRIERRPVAQYGFGDSRKLLHFLAGLAWGGAFLSLLVLALRLAGFLTFDRRLLFGPAMGQYGLIWLAGFLLVALFEEGLLRGYLQVALGRGCAALLGLLHVRDAERGGFWIAAVVLSLVFGLGHRFNPGESALGLASAALVGLVFCLSLRLTGSLWWAVGFHASWDWAQSFLYGVADSGFLIQHRLFATHARGAPLLSGGATGPEGSLFLLPILTLAAIAVLVTLRSSPGRPKS